MIEDEETGVQPLVVASTDQEAPHNNNATTPLLVKNGFDGSWRIGDRSDLGDPVISFRQANFGYVKKHLVLENLEVTVPRGCIYGLLGPSGCGKTTLLQACLGKRTLKSGQISVLGRCGETARIPGPRVGYMPQELALYNEFSIEETLHYFGRIYGMSAAKIRERTEFLMTFLDLQNLQASRSKRLIREMSGGQQRRVSLAAALLHQPELLILDEPTVGVDPLLRRCIWNHLLEISRLSAPPIAGNASQISTTIVITTHYIEEARQADVVGMMRSGRLLAEAPPDRLLAQYQKPNLEAVFLHLCLSDDTFRKSASEQKQGDNMSTTSPRRHRRQSRRLSNPFNDFLSCHRLRALLVKNFIRMWRNLGFLTFQFIIPTIQVALFCLAIGREPQGLRMAVVNNDVTANLSEKCGYFTQGCILGHKDQWMGSYDYSEEHKANLSCRFLSYIDSHFLGVEYLDDLPQALEAVSRGQYWGVMEFRENYTSSLYDRIFGMAELRPPSNLTLATSDMHAYLDMTNQQIGYTIQLRLGQAYQQFAQDLLSVCDVPAKLAALPITFEEPVYGSNEPTFTEFMAPGVILSITYFMAVGLTALSFIIERKEGLLERSWVAGVTATEVMLAHVVAQFAVMLVQVALVLIFMIYVFEVPAHGPMIWVVCLTLLQGLCGMAFGLVVSALCDNEQDAIQLALGSFYPNLLLSGIIWPLEGMLPQLRYISYILPQTYACEAMRGMLSRGWGIEWPQVYAGYLVTLAWTAAQLVLSAFILKMRL